MSRRPPNPAADRGMQNQQTLKTLVKVESNKSCADCKRNKHPRWASWNLGVFVCIRCSGIHRGMGTHISRVKSVDLDSWTNEQLASMLKWGNARANKYWESKLQPGHVPADAKIENFIRTKYESRRWVMDGPMPDPSTLDTDGDDEVPLNVVQEKAKLDRSASQRASSAPSAAPLAPPRAPPRQNINLFDDDPPASQTVPAPRPASAATPGTRPPPQQQPQQVKTNKTGDSLLGFDFFGPSSSNPPPRPSSAAASTPGTSAGPSRPDLKQSILSLYASKPQPPPQQHQRSDSGAQQQQNQLGGLDDAFGSLNFTSAQPAAQQKPSPFASPFANLTSPTSPPARSKPSIGGGSFFDPKPAPAPANPPPIQSHPPRAQGGLSSDGFGDFGDFTSAASPVATKPPPASTSSQGNGLTADLFDFGAPSSAPAPAPAPRNPPPIQASNYSQPDSSVFNLSSKPPPTQTLPPMPQAAPKPVASAPLDNPWGASDVWASNDTPAAPAPAPAPQPAMKSPPLAAPSMPPSMPANDDFGGWASAASPVAPAPPKVTADEDFGGWSSSVKTPPATSTSSAPPSKPAGSFGGGDDLFGNVWE